jgi:hypothetical protein
MPDKKKNKYFAMKTVSSVDETRLSNSPFDLFAIGFLVDNGIAIKNGTACLK